MKQLVIIGGSDAGISAALRARELAPDWTVRLVVADAFPNFSICGLPFYLSGETARWQSLAHRSRPEIEKQGIELLLDTTATHIDPVRKHLQVVGADGNGHLLAYDRLVIGTGAHPALPPIRGLDTEGAYVLHTMADSFRVHEHLAARAPRRALIVGAGYIGLEMADAFRHRDIQVTLCDVVPAVLPTVDPELGALVRAELERNGVELRLGASIDSLERSADGILIRDSGQREMTADLVLVATGVRPEVELARRCGVTLGERGALQVNRRMETNVPDVFAAGDCAETHLRMVDRKTYLPLGTTAHKQGRVAGENAVGGSAVFAGSLGTQVVKVFKLVIGRTGFRDAEAKALGFDPVTVASTAFDHKAYYPGATELHVRVTGDRRTGRLLGAQILGHYGAEVSKRIDIFAAALFHQMTVDDVLHLDLSYTPPLGAPWDPVQMSCMEWRRHIPVG